VRELKTYHEELKAIGVKVKGIVTDNENKMKSTRELHHELYGGCRPGCGPHAGNLISGDIFKMIHIKDTLKKAKIIASAIKVYCFFKYYFCVFT